jgi:hypothetical protein
MNSNKVHESGELLEESQLSCGTEGIRHWNIQFFLKQALSVRKYPVVSENFPIVAIVAAYVLAVYGAHWFFAIRGKVVLKYYSNWFALLSILFSAIFIILHLPKKTYKHYLTPENLAGFVIILVLAPLFQSAFASFKQTIPLVHGFSWDIPLMRLDNILHLGHHPWRLLEPLLFHHTILRIIDSLYMLWFLALFLFCLWMAWTQRRYLRRCFFVSTLLVWTLLGSGLGTVFSSAGPCYYSKVINTGDDPFVPLMSKLSEIHESTFLWAVKNQVSLWQAKNDDIWLPFGGISAMPSIHLAMATIFAILALNVNKWLGVIFIGYLCTMQVGSVILGWHYAVDGYVSIILACFIWKVVTRMVGRATV